MVNQDQSLNGESTPLQHAGKLSGQHASINRLREKTRDLDVALPPAWAPEPGGELVGHFVRWSEGTTSRGETHPIAVFREDGGMRELSVWCFYTVLRSKLQGKDLQPGELCLITRKADRTSKQGKSYRDYSVAVDRND